MLIEWALVARLLNQGPIDVLTGDHPDIAPDFVPVQAVPRVTLYSLDEALAQWRVHIRFITLGPNPSPTLQPSLGWYPAQDTVYADTFDPYLLDLDILPLQGRVLYSLRDADELTHTRIYEQTLGHEGALAYEQGDAFIIQPRWVAGGQFVAYRVMQGAQVPMWYLGGYGSDGLIPFAPDYDELLGTVDGFVLVDYEGGEVKFANTLAFEAYTPTVGNVIYPTDTSNFHIAYITPMGLDFTLESLAAPFESPSVDGGGDTVQSPPQQPPVVTNSPDDVVGGGSPSQEVPPSRVAVGEQFRVISRVGVHLGLDEYVFPTTGTIGTILAPDNPGFWQVEIAHEGGTVIGIVPEGAYQRGQDGIVAHYFIEPITTGEVNLDAPNPTPVPARPVSPTPARAAVPGDGDCSNAPVGANLTVGGFANVTLDAGDTLAMRANLDDPTPFYNVAGGRTVRVLDGPVCNGGFRMWYVLLMLPDGNVEGWVTDGFGNNRYLLPTPSR